MPPDDYEETLVNEIDEIFDQHLEAMRRAGVAESKREGYRIESTEALRLFREATGYLLRLRKLRDSIETDLYQSEYYDAGRIIGYVKDYNKILSALRENPSFENCVRNFEEIEYSKPKQAGSKLQITIDGVPQHIATTHEKANPVLGEIDTLEHVPMDGTTKVETWVYPRIIRLTEDLESSVIGRCASGKRPD
jgi:hypothetical protein